MACAFVCVFVWLAVWSTGIVVYT